MISVLQYHLADVFAGLLLPFSVADVLPARNLGKDAKPEPVALVNEMMALRIMRRSYRGAAELLLEYPRVLPLKALGSRVADIRPALVAVKTAEEGLFPV